MSIGKLKKDSQSGADIIFPTIILNSLFSEYYQYITHEIFSNNFQAHIKRKKTEVSSCFNRGFDQTEDGINEFVS